MAYWIQETGTNHNNSSYRLFYAETPDDISLMPTNLQDGNQLNGDTVSNQKCSLGSECLCISTGSLYILTNSGWQEV